MKQRTSFRRLAALLLSAVLAASCLSGCKKNTRTVNEIEGLSYGIDVARYQGTIDWQQVADSGIDFAMVRVGYRGITDGEITEDPNARYNLQEAGKAGIKLGAYFFSTAVTKEEAMEEAAWTADLLAGYGITYPVVYDCEQYNTPESRQYGMTKKERTDMALAFLETIEDLGYEGMFYSSKNEIQYENQWDTSRIEEDYKIWVAQYPDAPYPETAQSSYDGTHHMWQYTTKGEVPGITQPVDLNVAYFAYDGIETPKSRKTPEEVGPDVEAMMDFEEVDEQVTAKQETNLRDIPSQGTDSQVLCLLENGQIAQRIAVSKNGWSKLIFEGNTYYAVSSYLTTDLDYDASAQSTEPEEDGIQTQFTAVNQQVTAKSVVNLRKLPSVEHEDADVIAQLKNGDVATCVGVSDNGWAKLIYNGTTCYAVSSYLTLVSGAKIDTNADDDDIQTQFETVNERVTAKVEVNLRNLPSVENPDCVVVATIKNGDVVIRTGINRDVGWSRVEYNGQTLYCVSSYLTAAE